MKSEKGFTLIEVLIVIALLGITFVMVLGGISQSYLILDKGRGYTIETFDAQEEMEKLIVAGKNDFSSDFNMTVFGNTDYKATIELKEVKTNTQSHGLYWTYVSNIKILEPKTPVIEPFDVNVFIQGTNTKVFPWYEDAIELRGSYSLKNDPLIYQNRDRWYISKENENNPVFQSSYEVYKEMITDNPSSGSHEESLIKGNTSTSILAKRYYYFESRPFTFEGKIAEYRNQDRILVLNRNGSDLWQNLIEDAYFDRMIEMKSDVYKDVMMDPDWPTLDIDWNKEEDPEGALVASVLPTKFVSKPFKTDVKFQIDPKAIAGNTSLLGSGISLIDASGSGYMLTFDVVHNELVLRTLNNGKYSGTIPLKKVDLLTDPAFDKFRVLTNGTEAFDWSKLYNCSLIYDPDLSKIGFQLSFVDDADKTISSDLITIDLDEPIIKPAYIGFKSYSGLPYVEDNRYEISNRYNRNYGAHFKDLELTLLGEEAKDLVDIFIDENIFVYGSALDFQGSYIIGENDTIFINNEDGILNNSNFNGGLGVAVKYIYIQGKIDLNQGSTSFGSPTNPGDIHVDDSVSLGGGGRTLYGNVYVNGDFFIGGAVVRGKVYVNGDFGIGEGVDRNLDGLFNGGVEHVYYTGELANWPSYCYDKFGNMYPSYKTKIDSISTKVVSANLPDFLELPIPAVQSDEWYKDKLYRTDRKDELKSHMRLVVDAYKASPKWYNLTDDVIIIAKTGDIEIYGMGGRTMTGILFAPNGKVTFSGDHFKGLVIAKDGFFVSSGGTTVEFIGVLNFVDRENVPFKDPNK